MDPQLDLTHKMLSENRKTRRWNTAFKLLGFVYLSLVLAPFLPSLWGLSSTEDEHTAVINIKGAIAENEEASANNIVGPLRTAFEEESAKAIILSINSPGGSPVQAGYVYDEIQRLKRLHPKPVYAVISDIGASGGYYIAVAADEIYADKASLVGSIGVTASGFGFVDMINKVGVERRTYTSGEHKNFLDPFLDSRDDESQFWSGVLGGVHNQFKSVVLEGRGDRIDTNNKELFSGLIWNGEQALELGIIDGLGSAGYVAREVIEQENIILYDRKKSPLESVLSGLRIEMLRAINLSTGANSIELN
jgi:protease IV